MESVMYTALGLFALFAVGLAIMMANISGGEITNEKQFDAANGLAWVCVLGFFPVVFGLVVILVE